MIAALEFFFHEKGKVKLQHHTHLLIPKKNLKPEFDNETANAVGNPLSTHTQTNFSSSITRL